MKSFGGVLIFAAAVCGVYETLQRIQALESKTRDLEAKLDALRIQKTASGLTDGLVDVGGKPL